MLLKNFERPLAYFEAHAAIVYTDAPIVNDYHIGFKTF